MADAAHAPSDLWHRSLEDLLQAIETAEARATSPVAFAINLETSTLPIAMPIRTFPRFEKLRVYQLRQVGRDNSARFQLRLGIIGSDLEADAILSAVRKYYPSATKEVIGEADRTAIAQPVSPVQSLAPVRAPSKVLPMPRVPPKEVAAPSTPKADVAVEPRWNIDELLPNLVNPAAPQRDRPTTRAAVTTRVHQQRRSGAPQVRLSNVPIARTEAAKTPIATTASRPSIPTVRKAPAAAKPAEAVRARAASTPAVILAADTGTLQSLVAKIGTLVDAVETQAEATATPGPRALPPPAPVTTPVAAASPRVPVPVPVPVLVPTPTRAPAPVSAEVPSARTAVGPPPQSPRTQRVPSIDSTQTFRALTAVELSNVEASQWFVIQLMQAQQLIDPEQVPKLDIFAEYRLYSVYEPDQDQFVHALRLGFFSSEIAAQAVAGYLGAHFPTTSIKRVSTAERDRFAEQRVVAKKDVGESGQHAVIEVCAAPSLPMPVPVIAPAPAPSEADKRAEAPSLWSRLTRLRGA